MRSVEWPIEDIPAEVERIRQKMLDDGVTMPDDMAEYLTHFLPIANNAFYAGYAEGRKHGETISG